MTVNGIPIPPEVQKQLKMTEAALQAEHKKEMRGRARSPSPKNVYRVRWNMLNRFVDRHMATLPIQAAAVWLTLFRHADGKGEVVLAMSQLVKATGISLYSVRKGRDALVKSGLLAVKLKGNNIDGRYTTSRYKLES